DDFGAALDAADLVLARTGGSVWEVAAAGRPAGLVPSPNVTAGHPTKNARYFERTGGAGGGPQPRAVRGPGSPRPVAAGPGRLAEMGDAMRRAARAGAADEIAEELIAVASA